MKVVLSILSILWLMGVTVIQGRPAKEKKNEFKLENVRYFDFEKNSFSNPVDIEIINGKLHSILPNSSGLEIASYVLPGFCDTSVHLGFNSVGGLMDEKSGKLALSSFLAHGFTHLISQNPTPWMKKLESDIQRGKISSPEIRYTGKIIISKTKEYPELPGDLYYQGSNREEILAEVLSQIESKQKIINLYHRYYPGNDFFFDSVLIHDIDVLTQSEKVRLEVTGFTDRVAIYDAIRAGVFRIKDPIFSDDFTSLPVELRNKLIWTPGFYLYRSLGFQNDEERVKEFDSIATNSLFFKLYYRESASIYSGDLVSENLLKARENYSNFIGVLKNDPGILDRIYLGSGAGHFLLFPGVSGLEEYRIYYEVSGDPAAALRTMTVNSCSLVDGYSGTIQLGEEANLVLYKEDPLRTSDSIYKIENIILKGKLIESKQVESKSKVKSKK